MRFACEQCQTKYSIPVERVRGKILKIRCKTCSCLISVSEGGVRTARTAEPQPLKAPERNSSDSNDSTMIGVMSEFAGKQAAAEPAEEWHLSIDGNQHGPMPIEDLAHRVLELANTSVELFVWREGFEGWKAADAVPEVKAALEKSRSGTARSAVSSASAAPPASARSASLASSRSAPENSDATQMSALNLPSDLLNMEEDVQDAWMLSVESSALEMMPEPSSVQPPLAQASPPVKAQPPKPPPPKLPPPPFKAAPPKAMSEQTEAALSKTLPPPELLPRSLVAASHSGERQPVRPGLPPQLPELPTLRSEPAPTLVPPPLAPSLAGTAARPRSADQPHLSSPEPSVVAALEFGGNAAAGAVTQPTSPGAKRSKRLLFAALGLVVAFGSAGGYWLLTRTHKTAVPFADVATVKLDAGTGADAGPSADAGTAALAAAPPAVAAAKTAAKEADDSALHEGLDDAAYQSLLSTGKAAIDKCAAKAHKKADAEAALKVEVAVTAKGKASAVNLEGPAADGKIGKCVAKAIKKWKFPKGAGKKAYKARFTLPL